MNDHYYIGLDVHKKSITYVNAGPETGAASREARATSAAHEGRPSH